MNSRIIFLIVVFWMQFATLCKAYAPGDTTHASKSADITNIFTEPMADPFHQWERKLWTVDTTLHNFEIYKTQYDLGNTGLPYVPILFDPASNPLGFYYGNDYIRQMFYSDSTIRYFNTRAPYTNLLYVSDPQIHQFFHLCHAQNIGKHFDFALEFQRTRSDGAYINQGTNLNQVTLAVNYHIKRYELFANGMFGVYKMDQNGGIAADSQLLSPDFANRQTVAVNLQLARTTIRDKSIHLKQYFFFDYGKQDSNYQNPGLYLAYAFRMASHSNIYSDPGPLNTAFYDNFFNNGSLTYDSLSYNEMNNDVTVGTARGWQTFLHWNAGLNYQWVHYLDNRTDSIFMNYIAHACVYDTGKFLYNLQGREIFSGNEKGDYQLSAEVGVMLDSLRSIRLRGDQSLQTPPLIYQIYYGNNFEWKNQFNKISTSTASLIYNDPKWKLNIVLQATQLQNLVYFTTNAMPEQFNQAFDVLTTRLTKEFKLGKWHLNINEIYQYVQDGLPLRLPQFVSENSFFYENNLFHHAMLFRIGIDVYYNTSYYADAYMPVFDQYYLQDQTKLGNYPYLDPFISFRVKTFRMFIKFENTGAAFLNQGYYYALNYPSNDMTLRFGLSWDFWN